MSSSVGVAHDRRRAPQRLAGGQGGLAGDRRRAGRRPARARRRDRDRPQGRLPRRAAGGRTPTCSTSRPSGVAAVAGDRLPARVAPRLPPLPARPRGASSSTSRSRAGSPGPTRTAARAGTVHLGGDFDEIAAGEREIDRGRLPERPVRAASRQQYLADPERSEGDVHPIWAYAHVPQRLDRGRERGDHRPDRALRPRRAGADRRAVEPHAGRARGLQRQLRRRRHHHRRQHPLADPLPPPLRARPLLHRRAGGLHLLGRDAPGAGAHGMCGYNAAQSALRHLRAKS